MTTHNMNLKLDVHVITGYIDCFSVCVDSFDIL